MLRTCQQLQPFQNCFSVLFPSFFPRDRGCVLVVSILQMVTVYSGCWVEEAVLSSPCGQTFGECLTHSCLLPLLFCFSPGFLQVSLFLFTRSPPVALLRWRRGFQAHCNLNPDLAGEALANLHLLFCLKWKCLGNRLAGVA